MEVVMRLLSWGGVFVSGVIMSVSVWATGQLPSNASKPSQDLLFETHHEQGWHFYHEQQPDDDEPSDANDKEASEKERPSARATVKALRQEYEERLSQALLNPTRDNVRRVIVMQNQMSERSDRFSRAWKDTLRHHPELNEELKHPTSHAGKQVYLKQRQKRYSHAIHQLAQHSGLFFFYRGSCPYCRKFAPVVKRVAQQAGLTVVPVTLDGRALPSFPNSKIDRGQAKRFHVQVTPSLYVVNPTSHQVVPIGQGLMSQQQLTQRLGRLAIRMQQQGEDRP
jgi:conjugal transfer pilus assembly protein TraF